MIDKLYKLRRYIPDKYIDKNPYGLCLEYRDENVLVLDFKFQKDVSSNTEEPYFKFLGSHVENYSRDKNEKKYFFKKVPARGTSEFPTIFISKDSLNKNIKSFYKIIKKHQKLETLLSSIYENYSTIENEISEKLNNSNQLWILTISIDGYYIGELDLFKEVRESAKKNLLQPYHTLNNKSIKPQNKTCSVCLEQGKEVWGYVSTFNFYTSKTEHAPIAGGLNKSQAWKNYPVCPSCAIKLDDMKYFLENYLSYKFCGFSYYLIPEFINDDEKNTDILDLFIDKDYDTGKFSLSFKYRNKLSAAEDEILDILQGSDNKVNYTLFFFQKSNQEFKILLTIEDIYPTQFKEIFYAKENAENYNLFKNLENKKENTLYNLKFKFEFLKEFLPLNDKKYGDFSKQFLDITRSVFIKESINYKFLIHQIVQMIRRKFANGELKKLTILKIMLTLKFFYNLGILDMFLNKTGKEITVNKRYQEFFNEHSEFFDCPSKKAVFLEGVLCQKLLNWQWRERGGTPFRKKLSNLKLNPKIIKKLLPEIIEKLEQYEKNFYRDLEENISKLFLEAKLDKLSNNEISFYFVMGMNLSKELTGKEEVTESES